MQEQAREREAAASVVVVTGPTASGKSGLAVALAQRLEGVVINADSMQVYEDLQILTARPGPAALAQAPHRLYGVLPGREACSAGRWRGLALEEIEAALAAGRQPILVGGTGLYLKALREGLAELPDVPAAHRAAAQARHAELGGEAFRAHLAERDPESARRLHPSDRQRLIRAWEVLEATGRPLSAWQAGETLSAAPYRFLDVVVLPPRQDLYAACDGRFAAMLEAGALDEVRSLLAQGLSPNLPVMKALGVAELAAHLRGEITLEAAVSQAQQATRRYAKRQITWLRTQGPLAGCGLGDAGTASEAHARVSKNGTVLLLETEFSECFDDEIFNVIRDRLLTPPE